VNRRATLISLLVIVILAVGGLAATLAAGNAPQLGLDLQGGASVVLRPNRRVGTDVLNQSISIIRNRVDALGVAEPDVSRQGSNIVVQLPGVKDQKRALSIVGQTAQLRFRPVISELPPESATPTTAKATTTTTPGSTTSTSVGQTTTSTTSTTVPGPAGVPTTPRDKDEADKVVVLPEIDKGHVTTRFQLGPAELTGSAVRTAEAKPPQAAEGWSVDVFFTGSGGKAFDEIAKRYYQQRVAIVLDGVVKSAPTINSQNFNGHAVITGGQAGFSTREAKDLALVLRFGALPVQLEPQSTQTVSASLGKDSLHAGVFAGIVGLILVLLYMILYYRALGIVVVMGLAVSGGLLWTIVSYLGVHNGLALSLAGATGIIVSVGVTVDSYVVYFERLKDEIRSGKTIRSSVDRGFARAYRTILAADISSLIGAGLLYWLTVGPVRGFAFFLGLSTALDLITAYFFTRPMVSILGRNRLFTEARFFGVARGLAATPAGGSR
jgi:preprotein translocase subunit SecD